MNKTILYSLLLTFIATACNTIEKNTFVINGSTDLPEGKKIFRIIAGPNGQPQTVDTTEVVSGKFELKGDVDQIDVNFLFIEGTQSHFVGLNVIPFADLKSVKSLYIIGSI